MITKLCIIVMDSRKYQNRIMTLFCIYICILYISVHLIVLSERKIIASSFAKPCLLALLTAWALGLNTFLFEEGWLLSEPFRE